MVNVHAYTLIPWPEIYDKQKENLREIIEINFDSMGYPGMIWTDLSLMLGNLLHLYWYALGKT